ncbi:MAG: hypothetical protein ACRCWQ_02820 [Bacilli bacterium]
MSGSKVEICVCLFLLICSICVFIHGYNIGWIHVNNANAKHSEIVAQGKNQELWIQQITIDYMIRYVESLNIISQRGYVNGVKAGNLGIGTIIDGYINNSVDEMRRGHEILSSSVM